MAGPTLPRASEIGAPITCCGAWVIYSRLQRPQDAVYPLSKKDCDRRRVRRRRPQLHNPIRKGSAADCRGLLVADDDDSNLFLVPNPINRYDLASLPTRTARSSCICRRILPARTGSELAACPEKGNSIWYCGSTGRGKRPPRSSMAAGRRRPCNARHESCNPL